MRFSFSRQKLDLIFTRLKENTNLSFEGLSRAFGVSSRTIRDWRNAKANIPGQFLEFLKLHGVAVPKYDRVFDEYTLKSKAGKLGAKIRYEMYGNPGTPEGRKKGGLKGIKTMTDKGIRYFLPRDVIFPTYSEELAEFIGILLGDGGINERQISITLHKKNDWAYAQYVHGLIKRLFSVDSSIIPKRNENVVTILVSRVKIIQFLNKMGLPKGNKVKNQIAVPLWILESLNFRKACVRGLLDTDGCFYVDRHLTKGTLYSHCGMNFSNRSLPLLSFFMETLEQMGLHPTRNTRFSVFLRREGDIVAYAEEVGFANPKHLEKYQKFFLGRVPKRS